MGVYARLEREHPGSGRPDGGIVAMEGSCCRGSGDGPVRFRSVVAVRRQ